MTLPRHSNRLHDKPLKIRYSDPMITKATKWHWHRILHPSWMPTLLRVMKVGVFITLPAAIMLLVFWVNQKLNAAEALYAITGIFFMAVLLVRPYVRDLSILTRYVNQLALDKREQAPTLSFLSNVEELSQAVGRLHDSWESRRLDLEAALIESKIIFDTLPDRILMLDEEGLVVRANQVAIKHYVGQHLYKKPITDLIPEPAFHEAVHKVLRGEENRQGMELHFQAPSAVYWGSIERFPITSSGGLAAIIVLHDISETKRNEKMFADFVANASHEIRTPLTSLVGFIETLASMPPEEEDQRKKFLRIMEDQAERMTRLVGDLLSLSHIERNVHSQPTDEVAIDAILTKAIDQSQWLASQKAITLLHTPNASLPLVQGDARELAQVFTNLISNAIKYSSEGTTVTLWSEVSEYKEQPVVCVHVKDEGEGIAEEYIPRLTERFFRVDRARSRQVEGSGLGLAIVKHILNRHKGGLLIESKEGEGSVFTVFVPVRGE
jgi:two-component system phosphate regulon sensor histidine kinase PhoR